MDRAACWPTVHRVAQSQTQLKQLSVHSRVTYRDCVCVCVCVCVVMVGRGHSKWGKLPKPGLGSK